MKTYMLSVHTVEGEVALPDEDLQTVHRETGRINDEMQTAGVWVFGGGLLPVDSATVVRIERGTTAMSDGPFAETKEHVAGFWVIRCEDLDQALAWAGKCAAACMAPIEVRPFDEPTNA